MAANQGHGNINHKQELTRVAILLLSTMLIFYNIKERARLKKTLNKQFYSAKENTLTLLASQVPQINDVKRPLNCV